jgi:hypothetical protein
MKKHVLSYNEFVNEEYIMEEVDKQHVNSEDIEDSNIHSDHEFRGQKEISETPTEPDNSLQPFTSDGSPAFR